MADPFGDQDQSPGGAASARRRPSKAPRPRLRSKPAPATRLPRESEAEPQRHRPSLPARPRTAANAALPPAAASLPELKSFFTHLAAGLLGGLVGVVGAGLGLGRPRPGVETSAPRRMSPRWNSALAKLEAAPSASGDAEALSRSSRPASPPWRPASKRPRRKLADLADRVDATRDLAQGLWPRPPATAAPSPPPRPSPSRSARPSSGSRPRSMLRLPRARPPITASSRCRATIADLKAKLGALAEAELGGDVPSGLGPELAALTERIAKLEAALPELVGAIDKESNRSAKAAAVGHRLRQSSRRRQRRPPLRRRARHRSARSRRRSAISASLPAYAETGIPTVPELARSFVIARGRCAQVATAPASGGSLVDS